MDSYKLLRPLLFKLDAETAHHKVLAGFKWASKSKFSLNQIHRIYGSKVPKITVNLMGLQFKNPVGLAAGLDKDAIAGPALAALGFGFIELGTVTPQPQVGNPKPRMFRLQSDQAIINRMGFNSGGLSQFVGNFRRFNTDCISGINLGKNANTPNEDAISDYKAGMHQCYALADYLTINISSPNTKGLRNLQQGDDLQHLLKSMHETRCELEDKHQKRVPLALKIAPDLEPDAIKMIADTCQNHAMDAIIAANTTIQRPESLTSVIAKETGGLSGAPLSEMSTRIINLLRQALGESFPIIGVGGIMSAADAMEKFSAGANLVQIYTGFVYQGPKLIHEIVSRYENASRTG